MNIVLCLLAACYAHAAMDTVKPRHLCVQSIAVFGSCHTCVCDEQRIFRCNATAECNNKTIGAIAVSEKECEPEMIYNHDNFYCTCDEHGRWRSANCRQRFRRVASQNVSTEIGKFGGILLTHENFKPEIEEGDPCVPGEVYTIDCNVCHCGPRNSLLCSKYACVGRSGNIETNTLKDSVPCIPGKRYKMDCNTCRCAADSNLVCTKMACLSPDAVAKFKKTWKRKLGKIKKLFKNKSTTLENDKALRTGSTTTNSNRRQKLASEKCTPGNIHKKPCKKCFCTAEKELLCVKRKKCDKNSSLRSHIVNEDIAQLEKHRAAARSVPHVGSQCEPGNLYKVDCNTCWCSEKRELSTCSRKYCFVSALDESKRLSGRNCDKDISRSYNSCVRCDCVNNATKCNIKPDCKLHVQGNLLKNGNVVHEQFALDAEKDKCIPNSTYRINCNRCHCLEDGNLVCTSIMCLTNSQVKALEDKIAVLGI